MFSNKNLLIKPKMVLISVPAKLENVIFTDIIVRHLSDKVFQRTQNYFSNIQQQESTNQTENQLSSK
jgi:hypothetical protein